MVRFLPWVYGQNLLALRSVSLPRRASTDAFPELKMKPERYICPNASNTVEGRDSPAVFYSKHFDEGLSILRM